MFFILLTFSALLGLCIGSFLNVVVYRYATGMSALSGRSHCPSCNKELVWYELIPVFSFLIQGGQCRVCKSKISVQYPCVELLSGIFFALVFIRQYNLYYSLYSTFSHGLLYSSLFLLFYFIIVSILLVIAIYDYHHKIIPNAFVYWFDGLSIAKLLIFSFICLGTSPFVFPYIFDLFAPIILFIPFALLWLVSRGTWIGFGDAKLAIGIGALLGFVYGLSAVVIGFWIGAIICLMLMGLGRALPEKFPALNGKSEIPLGPFLIAGALIVLFLHIDALGIAGYFR
jgi:leader peptidase (prepilin peptidase)/N-methyltransferase